MLEDCAGSDASEPFEYAGHTSDAIKSMQQFLVGITEDIDMDKDKVLDSVQPASILIRPKVHGNAQNFKYMPYITTGALGMASFWTLMYEKGVVGRLVEADAGTAVGMGGFTVSLYVALFLLVFGGWGLMFLYSEFVKTLHQKEVFEYPNVIPRQSRKI